MDILLKGLLQGMENIIGVLVDIITGEMWAPSCVKKELEVSTKSGGFQGVRGVDILLKGLLQGMENIIGVCPRLEFDNIMFINNPSLVNLISKDANLVFYLSVYTLLNTLQSDYDVILMFVLIQRHKRRHSKSATSPCPDKGNMPWDRKSLLGHVETIQLILGVTDKIPYYVSYCIL